MDSGDDSQAIVVGFDGATFDLIQPLLDEGRLPNLAKMAANGLKSTLRSTVLPLSPPAWSSFLTGKHPGGHGIYDFAKRVKESYSFAPTTSLDLKSKTVWEAIGEAGGRSLIINVPLTYPPSVLEGVMITGFPTPTERGDYTYPPGLREELEKKFGGVGIHKPKVLYRKGREEEITRETIEITHRQTEITKYLMATQKWRLTVSVYDATDVLGHYFWAYLDPNHPKYDPKLAVPVRKMVDEIHVELDKAIGELFAVQRPGTLKMLMSDHGFGPVYYGVYINNWLSDMGYMRFKKSFGVRTKRFAFSHGLNVYNLLRLARKLRLVSSIESAYSKRSLAIRALNIISLNFEDVDWSRTRVYSAGNMGQLYLNMKGREPQGMVEQAEAGPLIGELISRLRDLEDPRRRVKMFDAVYDGRELYHGPGAVDAPDVVFLDQKMVYAAHRMFELGSNSLVTPHPIYSGNHKMDGILFAEGPSVKPGTQLPREPGIVDVSPTLLAFLGVGPLSDVDGVVIKEVSGREGLIPAMKGNSEEIRVAESVRGVAKGRRL